MTKVTKIISLLLLGTFLAFTPDTSFAWPTDADWIPVFENSTTFMSDPDSDSSGSKNLVGDPTYPTAYTFNDGTYIYYRLRLDDDPDAPSGGHDSFGWGFVIDTDQNPDDYEYLVMLDGIGNPSSEKMYLAENTTKTYTGDPSDSAETILWEEPLYDGINHSTGPTGDGSNFSGDIDYFLDFRIPYDLFKALTGLTDSSIIRYFIGSSNNAQSLTADLTAATLAAGLSEPVVPTGVRPTTGSVRFVSFTNWSSDVTEVYPGDTIGIRLEDGDQNYITSEVQTVSVTIAAASGDSETVTLTETGADTGIFTGSIPASSTDSVGVLLVEAIETVTVSYVDETDADLNEDQTRTDTLTVIPSADLELTKTVSDPTPNEGDSISYRISLVNSGPSDSSGVQVYDLLPSGVIYESDDSGGLYNAVTGTWIVPSVLSGYSSVLTINATVDTGTAYSTITNFANITSASQVDPDSANNADYASITVAGADIALTKSVDEPTPNNGDTVVFTITATNNGLNDATNIEITDLLPAGLSFSSYSSAGTYNSGTGLWSVGDLANGAGSTLKINASVTAASGTLVTNTALVTAVDQADPDSSNDTASASVSVGGTDISVNKVIDNSAPNEGDAIYYTITVTNNGSNGATGLALADSLPTGITYLSDSGGGSYNSGNGIWTIGNLANGGSVFLNISAIVDAGTAGTTITNNVSVSALDQLDPVSGNDSSSVEMTVQKADLKIIKTVDNSGPNEGDTINYTLTVSNLGPHPATGVEVTDSLPSGVTFSSYSATEGSYDSGTGIWSAGAISNGTSAVLTLTATVDAGTALTTINNTASITAADQVDPVGSNNSASKSISVSGVDLEITKVVSNPSPSEGETIYFTLTMTNNGPNDATGIAFEDLEPTGLTFVSQSSTDGYWHSGHNHWHVDSLANGATATMTIGATVDAGTTGQTIVNTVRLDELDQGDYVTANNSDAAEINVGGLDLAIAKSVSDSTPTIGDTITYTLTITNNGPADATGIKVADNLPAGVTFSSYSATQGTFNNTSGIWTAGSVTAAAPNTATLYLNATVDAGTAGWTITNNATISAADQNDSDGTNDNSSAAVTVQAADLSVLKTADNSTPDEGGTVTYTVTLTNNGPHDATGIEVTDLLPAGVTYQSYSTAFGAYSSGSGLWNIGGLAKLSSATLKIRATVDAGTGGSNITNTATVTASDIADTNAANDSSSFVISPTAMPFITITKVVATISDPVNGVTGPKAIPGAVMEYTVSAMNTGLGAADAGTVIVTDPIPADTEFYANDLGGPGPVVFNDGLTASGLGYSFLGLGSGADSIDFLDSGDNLVTPSPDADGFDANVAKLRITFSNSFNASDGTKHPSFSLRFRVRVK